MKWILNKEHEVPLMRKIKNKVRYGMTLFSISSILQRIGIEFTPYILFLEGMNITEMPEINGLTSDYSVELLGLEDIKKIGTFNTGFSEEEFLSLLSKGGKCIGLKHKGEIAAFLWINFTECNYKTTLIHLKNNEAYLWYMFTVVAYRGRHLAPYLEYKSCEILKGMGRDVLYSISDYLNTPAVNYKKNLHAKKLKLILFIKLFNKFSWSFTLKEYK